MPLPAIGLEIPIRKEINGNSSELVQLIPALRAFARTFMSNGHDADDLVQETLVKAIAAIETFQQGTQLKSWLFTIMRNTAYTRYKKASRERPGYDGCASVEPVIGAPQEWRIAAREMSNALQTLPAAQREVVILIGVLGVSYEEAAKICNCELGTVKSRLNRGRAALASVLGDEVRPRPCYGDGGEVRSSTPSDALTR